MEGGVKIQYFQNLYNLGDHQINVNCYIFRLLYIKLIITTDKNLSRYRKNKEKGIPALQ